MGRLDKDTTGLLVLTNDGALAHALLNPKRHVWKRYIARVSGRLDEADAEAFAAGMALDDFVAKPAKLAILPAEEAESLAAVELRRASFIRSSACSLRAGMRCWRCIAPRSGR